VLFGSSTPNNNLTIIYRVSGQKTQVSLILSQAILAMKDEERKKNAAGKEVDDLEIPQDHSLDVSAVTRQALGVFSHHTRTII
jgi:hypothetical protein